MVTLLLALTVGVLGGCPRSEPKTPAKPPPPPPPTPEEIASEIRQSLQPINALPPGLPVHPEINNQVRNGLRSAKNKHQTTENGKEALNMIANELKNKLTAAQEAEHWYKVVLICDVLQILSPGVPRYEKAKEKARIQINRPKVRVTGFFTDAKTEEVIVFLDVFLPETGRTESVKVREGQEFLRLKLLNIVGKNRGVNLEYLRTGDQFEVYGPNPTTPRPGPPQPAGPVGSRARPVADEDEEEEDY